MTQKVHAVRDIAADDIEPRFPQSGDYLAGPTEFRI
jgi:hypothetical protein